MNNSSKIKEDLKLNRYTDIECHECGELIEGKWDSQVYLGMETGELSKSGIHRWLIYDKHIKCSPSRAQRIVHPRYPTVVDERPNMIGGGMMGLGMMKCGRSSRNSILILGLSCRKNTIQIGMLN